MWYEGWKVAPAIKTFLVEASVQFIDTLVPSRNPIYLPPPSLRIPHTFHVDSISDPAADIHGLVAV